MIASCKKEEWITKLESTGLSIEQAATVVDILASAVDDLAGDLEYIESGLDDVRKAIAKLQDDASSVAEKS